MRTSPAHRGRRRRAGSAIRIQPLGGVVDVGARPAAARTARPRARPTGRSSVWTWVDARDGPAGASPSCPSSCVERLCEDERHRLEAEAAPDRLARACSTTSTSSESSTPRRSARRASTHGGAPLPRPAAAPATHVDGLDVPAAGVGPARLDHAHRPVVVLGEQDTRRRHLLLQLGPLLLPRLGLEAVRLGHLGLELLPELAQRLPRPRLWQGGRSRHREAGQEVVGGEILERVEARSELVHVGTVEEIDRLPQREVAGGPGASGARGGARGTTRPSTAPIPRQGDEAGAHLVVGELVRARRGRVGERASPITYSAFLAREAQRDELRARCGLRDPLARRERPGATGRVAEALDEAAADRERRAQRDLLRGDRGDEALERVGRERRPEPLRGSGRAPDARAAWPPRP